MGLKDKKQLWKEILATRAGSVLIAETSSELTGFVIQLLLSREEAYKEKTQNVPLHCLRKSCFPKKVIDTLVPSRRCETFPEQYGGEYLKTLSHLEFFSELKSLLESQEFHHQPEACEQTRFEEQQGCIPNLLIQGHVRGG